MQTETSIIFEEYNKAKGEKEALGEKGLFEQIKINERFYEGNQWYGANCGNDRPLVRHNIIKRIGDFKMSQAISDEYDVFFSTQNGAAVTNAADYGKFKEQMKKKGFAFKGEVDDLETYALTEAFSDHYYTTADRLNLDTLIAKALRQAYITGSGILYTFFNTDIKSGFDNFGTAVNGDIACEILNVRDVYFGDATQPHLQLQPYIIIASSEEKSALIRQAKQFGTESVQAGAKADNNGKVLVLTKLYKTYLSGRPSVRCVKVTEAGVLRADFDTRLKLYPLSIFRFGEKDTCAYGESEIPYLIPNQIAVNRMITASVWSNIACGMPMMIVNGDTVSGDISNDPGQILKIYGTNEDVEGAVKFVSPPDISAPFNAAINNLIENTLTQSGANPASLGDGQANNASAIEKLQNASVLPLKLLKSEYKSFILQTANIWADFWLHFYSNRRIKTQDESGIWYFPYNAQRYSDTDVFACAKNSGRVSFTPQQTVVVLAELYDKGVISKSEYISRLPDSLIPDKTGLILRAKEKENDT